jgi:S1-C subfamily serine protease
MNGLFSLPRMRSLWLLVILFVVGEVPFTNKKILPSNAQSAQIDLPNANPIQIPETKPTVQPNPTIKSAPIGTLETATPIQPTSSSTKTPETNPTEQNIPTAKLIPITSPEPVISPRIDPSATETPELKPTNSPNPPTEAASISTLKPIIRNVPDSQVPTTNEQSLKPKDRLINADLNPIEISRSITVKITAPDFIGSGTIVGFENGTYTVITNAHVIIGGEPPYRLTTSDRVVHQAKVITHPEFKKYDLAVLQFRAPAKKYSVAKLGNSTTLKVGDRLFVGGFTKQFPQRDRDNFLVQTGVISLVLESGMNDSGYKIGYTHRIYRGMSGGSVIDDSGRLVGINGLLGDPVWKVITKFADGSTACEPLQILIDRSGFAIAIDDVISLLPHSKWGQKRVATERPKVKDKTSTTDPKETVELQQTATKALSCH